MIRLPKFDYFSPKTIPEACQILSQFGSTSRVLAGGTDLLINMKMRTRTPKQIVSLKKISELQAIEYDDEHGLRLGSMVTLNEIEASETINQRFPVLAQATSRVASLHLRRMATIGGNIALDTRCWYYNQPPAFRKSRAPCFKTGGSECHEIKGADRCWALFCADAVPALLASGAQVKIARLNGEKVMPLKDLYTGKGEPVTYLQEDELITEIQIPAVAHDTKGAYIKHALPPEGTDFPLTGVAAVITRKDGLCQEARIWISGIASSPFQATQAELVLKESKLEETIIQKAAGTASSQARPVPFMGISADYRRKMVRVCVERALKQALKPIFRAGRD